MALVRLEKALRARDVDYACRRVYARIDFDGSFAKCKRNLEGIVRDFKEYSLSVQRVTIGETLSYYERVSPPDRMARADMLVTYRTFVKRLHVVNEHETRALIREADGWRVRIDCDC